MFLFKIGEREHLLVDIWLIISFSWAASQAWKIGMRPRYIGLICNIVTLGVIIGAELNLKI